MKVPVLRALCLGEFSTWGKQFIEALHSKHILDTTHEPSIQRYMELETGLAPHAVILENVPESQQYILKIRHSGKKAYLIWIGRGFSKEDLTLAIEKRIYCVIEAQKNSGQKSVEDLTQLALTIGRMEQFEEITRSLKSILLQAEGEIPKPILDEIKVAVSHMEPLGLINEFSGAAQEPQMKSDGMLPLAKEQGLADALSTVYNLERTGVLWVRGPLENEEGKIEFLQGKIVSAIAGEVHGIKAIYRMFLWDSPRFLFMRRDAKEATVEEVIDQSLKSLCNDGLQWKKRYESIRREVPPSNLKLELEPSSLHAGTNLGLQEFSVLASVIEFSRVSEVLDYNPLPDVSILEALISLKKNNLIRVSV